MHKHKHHHHHSHHHGYCHHHHHHPHPHETPEIRPPSMRIDGVTICVNYADFLAHTLPFSRTFFDRYVIVTTPTDRATRDLCEHYHVECITTTGFYEDEAKFAKSHGINMGLAHLKAPDWVVHMDADIVLPPRSRSLLVQLDKNGALPKDHIYGIDRLMCSSFEDWANFLCKPQVQHSCNTFIQMDRFPTGTRVGRLAMDGWLPIGFFQMWHPNVSGAHRYPESNSCEISDYRFGTHFPRAKRTFLPEFAAIHLDSSLRLINDNGRGVNWDGRKTPPFGLEAASSRLEVADAEIHT